MAALPDRPPSSAPPEARVLDGQRFDLPCTHVDGECKVTPPNAPTVVVNRTVTFGGAPGTTYHVTLRFRGVVERKIITGGVLQDPYFRIGGTPSTSHYNEYSLRVSSPRAVYYLNDGPKENTWCVAVDYTKTVDIDGGAQVTLFADSHNDQQIENRDDKGKPIVFPGLPPAPLPYDGQFLQIDVVSVTR
jgi:hypothetical protein